MLVLESLGRVKDWHEKALQLSLLYDRFWWGQCQGISGAVIYFWVFDWSTLFFILYISKSDLMQNKWYIYKMHRPELKSFIISFLQPQLLCQQLFHECIILNPGHQHIFSLLQLWSRGRGTGRAVLKMQTLYNKLQLWALPTRSARESDLQVKSANSGSKVPKTTIYEIWLIEKMIIGSMKKGTHKVTKAYSTTKLKISGWSSICGLRRSKMNWQLARGNDSMTWHGGCLIIFYPGICFVADMSTTQYWNSSSSHTSVN